MASQQAPSRPWFRLASMVRPPAQPQPPQPIRPPFPRPTRPTQPQPQNSAPTPPPPLAAAPPSTTISSPPPAVTAPVHSPAITKASDSLPPSPKLKFSSPSSSLPNSTAVARPVSSSSSTAQPPQAKALLAPSSSVPNSPAVARPVSSSSSAALSPQTKVFSAPSSSLPTSPAPKVLLAPSFPNPSAKTPIQSPKNNPVSSPPSPLILPPALMRSYAERQPKNVLEEAEEKTLVVQEINLKPQPMPTTSNANSSPNGKQVAEKDMGKKEQSIFEKLHASNGFGTRVITIAGENKGAVMELGSHKKHDNPIAGSNGNKSGKDSSSEEEGKSKMNGKTHKAKAKAKAKARPRMTALMNSNVQCVNNSILCNSSCTHHDPGVHLSLPAKPNSGKQT